MGVSVQYQMQPAANFPEHHRFNIAFITNATSRTGAAGPGFSL